MYHKEMDVPSNMAISVLKQYGNQEHNADSDEVFQKLKNCGTPKTQIITKNTKEREGCKVTAEAIRMEYPTI